MNSKERMLYAILNKKPDMVPVAPDISNMIPAKMSGRPFWDIYFYNNPPLWKAYLNALDYFKFDGWFIYGSIELKYENLIEEEKRIIKKDEEKIEVEYFYRTPEGSLHTIIVYPKDNPPWVKEHLIKNFKEDFKKIKYFSPSYYTSYTGFSDKEFLKMKNELGDNGVIGIGIPTPGFHIWQGNFEGGLLGLSYAYYDYPELFDEWAEIQHKDIINFTEYVIKAKPDFILTGGSGAITLASPSLFRKYSLPTIKVISEMANKEKIPVMIHCCGKERALVEMCYNETLVNCINPLEEPPMGDCYLSDIKKNFGDKISLMGNINTTFMLKAKPEEVERVCKKAIDDAGENGGFILSTGDQLGRDTPEENIFKMIEVARKYGKYF
jgi:uroporphyrinogen decarboxylase